MKKRALIAAAVVVLLGAIVFASIRSGGPKGEKVYAEAVAPRLIEAVVSAPGQIDPKVKVNISAHVIGKIERLYFVEGQAVRRGQKLVDLEKVAYVANRDRMRAQLAAQRVEVARARAALQTARSNFRRAEALEKQGIQAQEMFDRSRLELSNAQAGYSAAEEGVRQAAAGLKQAEDDLSRTTIVAPMDGKIVQLSAHEGEVVVTGTMNNPGSVIAVLADLSQILVEAEVGETEVVSIRTGQGAKIKVDAVPDKEYTGTVVEIGSSAASRGGVGGAGTGIRYFKVKIAIANADERLRPGMTAQVAIVTNRVNTIALPIQAVVERVPGKKAADDDDDADDAKKKKFVFVVRDEKADMREVTTGISDATHVAIVSGVAKGDMVVTGPFRTLKKLDDDAAVVVTKEETKPADGGKKSS